MSRVLYGPSGFRAWSLSFCSLQMGDPGPIRRARALESRHVSDVNMGKDLRSQLCPFLPIDPRTEIIYIEPVPQNDDELVAAACREDSRFYCWAVNRLRDLPSDLRCRYAEEMVQNKWSWGLDELEYAMQTFASNSMAEAP